MHSASLYRSNIREAVRIFRPVLQALKIRDKTDHPLIFFAAFEQLSHLSLDQCSVQVLTAEMNTLGIFIFKQTKQGSLRAFIILNKLLYNNQKQVMKELCKIAGVHEFVHFLAMVYVATASDTSDLRQTLMNRLQHTVDKLPGADLLTLYDALKSNSATESIPELTDAHFRLGYEGQTVDYELLFLHLMFSRDLFEEYFDSSKQSHFKALRETGKNDDAIRLLQDSLSTATKEKDIPEKMALNQLLEWVHVYTR